MLSFLRSSIIEKITKSNIFILYISNYLIRYFRFFLLPYEKEWNVKLKNIKYNIHLCWFLSVFESKILLDDALSDEYKTQNRIKWRENITL